MVVFIDVMGLKKTKCWPHLMFVLNAIFICKTTKKVTVQFIRKVAPIAMRTITPAQLGQ